MSLSITKAKKEARFFKRLVVLVGFKETYFLAKNLLGMIIHPELTTAKILAQGDLTQAFLVFGLPFNLWLILVSLYLLIWLFLKPASSIFQYGLSPFFFSGFLLMLMAFYDLYWVIKYLKGTKQI